MGLLDVVGDPQQSVAYMFPEVTFGATSTSGPRGQAPSTGAPAGNPLQDVFVFQFWPQQVADRYQTNYATKQIPGASHPLYQWVGGGGRTISFDANFVSEIAEGSPTKVRPFNERVTVDGGRVVNTGAAETTLSAALLPSSRYTVNVAGAIAALQRYLYGHYNEGGSRKGIVEPPRKLYLVLPGTSIGRGDKADAILCILLRADVTMESFFPSGQIRSATISLEFAEIIQHTSGNGSRIKNIDASAYNLLANSYLKNGTTGK